MNAFRSFVCMSTEVRESRRRHLNIEKRIEEEQGEDEKIATVKLLLLGAAESGKSTVLKQMKILHDNGFDDSEIDHQKMIIYSNTVNSMVTILSAMKDLNIPLDKSLQDSAEMLIRLIETREDMQPFSSEVKQALKELWEYANVQQAYNRRSEYFLPDSAKYFLDSVDRTSEPDYVPTREDILYTRLRTTGLVEIRFMLNEMKFRVFDVGGQRNERKKWIHCFDDVNAIIFVTSLSEFDQILTEDGKTNRMHESLQLFSVICNSSWFKSASIILFLNKRDLFKEKIEERKMKIDICFPTFNGPHTYKDCVEFISKQFTLKDKRPDGTIYSHETCAVDTNQIEAVLDSCFDMICEKNMEGAGFY